MNKQRRALLAVSVALTLPLMTACATRIKASDAQNPAPREAFSAYGRIVLKPVSFAPGQNGDAGALAKIAGNLEKNLHEPMQQWNRARDNGRTLTIEPVVEQMSFKSSTKRVLLGPLAGSSGVLMRVTFRDQAGNIIARPEFFQRANAMSGAFTLGVQDNLMLTRVTKLASDYIIANYTQAVGGPTGADDAAIASK
ncbi:hypothetical protein LE190_05490 [Massilia oculi]|uniref:DUF4410 domain-containing protein n=1 Tax=Massilia hydrophila TaxID=3044279 RepID=A0ABS7Y6S9_9BURK|nr:hypothetical protein [Massilia oculi]MCA1855377.1 hypothetical protein [Massilia oculi]